MTDKDAGLENAELEIDRQNLRGWKMTDIIVRVIFCHERLPK